MDFITGGGRGGNSLGLETRLPAGCRGIMVLIPVTVRGFNFLQSAQNGRGHITTPVLWLQGALFTGFNAFRA